MSDDQYKVVVFRNGNQGMELEIIPECHEATIRSSMSEEIEFGARNLKEFADTIEAWRDLFQAALNEVRKEQDDGGS